MTPDAQLALIATILPAITALGALVAVVVNRKLDHITVLTNSTLTAANRRIEELENIVNRLVAERESKVK